VALAAGGAAREGGVATVGDNCIDQYLAPVARSAVGGNAVNVAVQLARRGRPAAYFGAVGDDAPGRRIIAALRAQGVAVEAVRTAEGVTAMTDLRLEGDGERTITREDFGVCAAYAPGEDELALLARARHVHIGWLRDPHAVRGALAARGVSLSQDCAVAAGFDGLAIAFCSAGEDPTRAPELARQAIAGGARLAVVTCGRYGSMAFDGTTHWRTDAAPTRLVDTTGAGDAFIAAFIDAYLAGREVQGCLEAGRDAGAEACSYLGGWAQETEPLAG
jgi:fructoselysine 6-kinase